MRRSLKEKLKIDRKIRIGYGAAFFLLLISYLFTWYANKQSIEQTKWVMKTNTVINHLDNLISYMKDAETGVRGYYITKDESFLEPFYNSRRNIDSIYKILDKEVEDYVQRAKLIAVKKLVDDKYSTMSVITSYDRGDA